MTLAIPYVRDLRATAAAVAVHHIAVGWQSPDDAARCAAVEAGLEAANPFLIDAFLIEEAVAAVDRQQLPTPRMTTWSIDQARTLGDGNLYQYLRDLQRSGSLCLRTLKMEDLEEDGQDAEAWSGT
jgi:hypothetical protein